MAFPHRACGCASAAVAAHPYRLALPRTALVSAIMACAAQAAWSQQTLGEIQVTGRKDALERPQLDVPITTGSRLGLTARETPGSVTLLDRENITPVVKVMAEVGKTGLTRIGSVTEPVQT